MSEAYPPTGRYDDLLMLLARAEERRLRGKIPVKTRAQRLWIEPFWNVFGILIAAAVRALPADAAGWLHNRLFLSLVGAEMTYPFDEASGHVRAAAVLKAEAEERAGRPAALFCLASHPPAFGELLRLNIELVRHALWALRRLRGRPCRPRLVIGMDYFALDMLAIYEEGAYAGFTGRYHLGIDRLAHLRPPLGRGLLGGAAWTSVGRRLLSRFAAGGEVGMVLGGGVPETSRVFYCAREFVGRLYRERPDAVAAAGIRRRLVRDEPDFERFFGSNELGVQVRRNIRRAMEAWVLSCLAGESGLSDVDAGRVPAKAREALAACARALGYGAPEAERLLKDFAEEFARETPYRERFFSAVARRVGRSGVPLVILPLLYGSPDAVAMRFGEPVCLLGAAGNAENPDLSLLLPGGEVRRVPLRRFCRYFVTRHYP